MSTPLEIIKNIMSTIDALSADIVADKPAYTNIEKFEVINTALVNYWDSMRMEGEFKDFEHVSTLVDSIMKPLMKAYCCSLNNSHTYPEAIKALAEAANKCNDALPETLRYQRASSP